MDDTLCPRCKTTKYRNPNLKLMVNVCGHALCESCVDLLFVRGSGNCPECNIPLRRTNFRLQFFEDASIEKEIEIRKKVLKDYNRKEDDFHSLREFNDYLEEVETIIFNLVNNVDVEATRRKMEQYKKDNKDMIAKNRFKKSADDIYLENLIADEASYKTHYVKEALDEDTKERLLREKNQQLLIDDLMFSDAAANEIVQSHTELQQRKAAQAEKAKVTAEKVRGLPSNPHLAQEQSTFIPIPKKKDVLYQYVAPNIDYLGPLPPSLDDVLHKGYLRHIRAASNSEKAGGYEAYMGCLKALQAAVDGLYLSNAPHPASPAQSISSSAPSSEIMDVASP